MAKKTLDDLLEEEVAVGLEKPEFDPLPYRGQGSFPEMEDWGTAYPASIPTPEEEALLREQGINARSAKAEQEAIPLPLEEAEEVTEDE